ncbi:hypothetical protein LUZ61_013759 [Rhynchospora tenuis]|uniref:Uncharacterized protein n=1 Tax=Rhynchospora tenuis TaxID=198213 RepID=A0AAD5W9C7_9POAL|nr:hypothetical protein LUZ61_013759 [Rhynchospora tenuis]
MAPKRKLGPYSEGAGPSRPAKSRELTSSYQENMADPSTLEMQRMIRAQNSKKELQAEIRAHNLKIEEHYAEIRAEKLKIEKLQAEVNAIDEQYPSMIENPIDENQATREPAHHRKYGLRIIGKINERVYTGSQVEGQDGKLLKVAIFNDGQKITSGSLASAKFKVMILKGSFGTNDQTSWTSHEFEESLVEARSAVGTILAHAYEYQFFNGEAVLEGLKFKDNSNRAVWRLGIKVLGSFNGRVQEAISDPFRVLDRHGKASEKPDIPLLEHGVECIKKVGKDRASDLKEKNGINTVKDFLQLYHKNPEKLRKILKINSESDESWKTMIRHAKKCDAGSDLYSYRKETNVLFFNSVHELIGARFGNGYKPFDKLQNSEKILVNEWKEGFYENIKDKSFPADFKLLNGQPVPIGSNVTGNPTDDDASQHGPGLQHAFNYQPESVSYVPASNPGDLLRPVSSVPDTDSRILLDLGNMESWDVGLLLDSLGEQPALVDTPSVQRNHRARGRWLVVRFVLLRQRRDPSVAKLKLARLILVARFLTKLKTNLKIAHSIAQLMTYLSGDPVAN